MNKESVSKETIPYINHVRGELRSYIEPLDEYDIYIDQQMQLEADYIDYEFD